MSLLINNARVYDSERKSFFEGSVLIDNGIIAKVSRETIADDGAEVIDVEGKMLVPGLIDMHTHGRAGGDFNYADKPLMTKMAKSYLLSGTTAVMPTLASATPNELISSIETINSLADEDGELPYIVGIHLEGRYLNPKKRGAHAPELLAPLDADELESIISHINGAKHISAALELDNDGSFLRRALDLGATVGLGHTAADYATASRLIDDGVTSMTHLFNTMPPLHHRDGGVVAAGLLGGAYCELICDGFHISPEMVKLAYRLLKDDNRLVLITDSMEATGCADGEYSIAGMPVIVKNGEARTIDGAIAGSTLTLLDGVKKLTEFADITFEEALYFATMTPALALGVADIIGSIDVGKRADMLILDNDLHINEIVCGGRRISR